MHELANRVKVISSSSTLSITARAKEMRKAGYDVVNFAAGEPDFDTPQAIKEAAILSINDGFTKYTPSSGIPELKSAIQKKFKNDNNLDYESNQIIVSSGAKYSLFGVIQALIEKGDEVIIPSPYWVSYLEMVKFAQGKPVIIEASERDSFKVNPSLLIRHITKRTKAFILNSPSNPAGYIYNKEELSAIAEICVKNNILVISDEIYEKLIYEDTKHVSIASLNRKIYDLTFVINGVSKAYSMTGWRIGYLAGNVNVVDAMKKIQDHSTSNPCSISQKAALAALSLDNKIINKMRSEFESRRNYMLQFFDAMSLEYVRPQGAFYIFFKVSKTNLSSWDFSKRLLEDKYVASIPGGAFGKDDYVRFSFATSKQDIEKGMRRLSEFLKSL